MFTGLGVPEIVLILGALVLLFGAKRIPQIARGLGSGIRDFKASLREPPGEEGERPPSDPADDGSAGPDAAASNQDDAEREPRRRG